MVNINLLKGTIIAKGFNVAMLADKIGMDKATFYRKLSNNGEPFTIRDADSIMKELSLSVDEAVAIFFSQYVA